MLSQESLPCSMGELLEYFEARSRVLDNMEMPTSPSLHEDSGFTSCICFSGVPILPPVLSLKRREEMQSYKRLAVKRENQHRAKRRGELVARVQSIVAGVEERKARASAEAGHTSQSVTESTDTVSDSSFSDVKPSSQRGGRRYRDRHSSQNTVVVEKQSPEIVVSEVKPIEQGLDKSVKNDKRPSSSSSHKRVQRSASDRSHRPRKTDMLNFPVSAEEPARIRHANDTVSDDTSVRSTSSATSLSEQELRIPSLLDHCHGEQSSVIDKVKSPDAKSQSSSGKNSSRPRSGTTKTEGSLSHSGKDKTKGSLTDLQPHPEDEISQTDLRHRPDRTKGSQSDSVVVVASGAGKTDTVKSGKTFVFRSGTKSITFKAPTSSSSKRKESPREKANAEIPTTEPTGVVPSELGQPSQDEGFPTIETTSDFTSLEDCNSLPMDFNGMPLTSVRQQHISHVLTKLSQALNIEDTLGSTGSSMVSADTTQTNTTVRENTGGATGQSETVNSEDSNRGTRQSSSSAFVDNSAALPTTPTTVASTDLQPPSQDSSLSSTPNTGSILSSGGGSFMSSGGGSSSSHGKARMSPTASILSSGSSVSSSQKGSRMSPKSLKNTVHFASFVTEISTSASQSMEEKITMRKLEKTPTNSPRISDDLNGIPNIVDKSSEQLSEVKPQNTQSGQWRKSIPLPKNVPLNFYNLVPSRTKNSDVSDSMLSKVALSPDTNSPGGSPEDGAPRTNVPFQTYSGEGEHNTSDKENELGVKTDTSQTVSPHRSIVVHDSANLKDMSVLSRGEFAPGVLKSLQSSQASTRTGDSQAFSVKSSVKSQNSDTSESSTITIKGSQDHPPTLSTNNLNMTASALPYPTASTDIGKYMRVSAATIASSMTMPDEVSQSYMASQNLGSSEDLTKFNVDSKPSQSGLHGSRNETKQEKKESNIPHQQSPILLQPVIHKPGVGSYRNHLVNTSPGRGRNVKSVQKEHTQNYEDDGTVSRPALVENIPADYNDYEEDGIVSRRAPVADKRVELNGYEEDGTVQFGEEEKAERQGKAEHIERYLSQVHENSLLQPQFSPHEPSGAALSAAQSKNSDFLLDNIGATIQSFTASLQSMDSLSEEELLGIQAEQFNTLKQQLIEQQKQQLEELFVHQRREQMHLQLEIENYHKQLEEQQTSLLTKSTEELNNSTKSQNSQHSQDQTQNSHQFSYISSPSLYMHPKDRDNQSEVSTFGKNSPKQLVFSETPTSTPKLRKPVVRSPRKQAPLPRRNVRVVVPERAYDSNMQRKYDRLTAVGKGFLVRCLLKTDKVQELIKTVRDTREFAFSFQAETPIKRGNFSNQDRDLLERIIAQLQAALLDIHEIFFIIPVSERMGLIAQTRQLREQRRYKETNLSVSVSSSNPRISSATLKAMERKRRALIAEASVFGNVRARSAPPTSSPRSSHSNSVDLRALRPLQGHISPIRPDSQASSRYSMERPRTAGAMVAHGTKPKRVVTAGKVSKPGGKSKVPGKPKLKTGKAWR